MKLSPITLAITGFLGLVGCNSVGTVQEPRGATLGLLDSSEQLNRVSFATRGLRASEDELERARAGQAELATVVDAYLASPEFGATIRRIYGDRFAVTDDNAFPAVPPLDVVQPHEIGRSVMQAPLRFIEHIVRNDLPFTDVVTANYLVTDKINAAFWGLPFDTKGAVWQVSHYTDGRPAAGILSNPSLFLRHLSVGYNYNRGRANAISKALLCYDFQAKEVKLAGAVDFSNPEAANETIAKNPNCVSCHQTLDPLASYLWGHIPAYDFTFLKAYPVGSYAVANQNLWQNTSHRPPAYFGLPGTDLGTLGQQIADDPRFSLCAVRTIVAGLAGVDLSSVPEDMTRSLQEEFVQGGYNVRALAKRVLTSPEFATLYTTDSSVPRALLGFKKARPEQVATLVKQLTGFEWTTDVAGWGRTNLATNANFGFKVLGGGTDGRNVTRPSSSRGFNITESLFLSNFAREAANFAVNTDLATATPKARKLLALVPNDPNATTETDARNQIVDLHFKICGNHVAPDAPEVSAAYELYSKAAAKKGATHAWKLTLHAMLQDPCVAFY